MMFAKFLLALGVCAAAIFSQAGSAQAGIPIPCTSEKIVRVQEIPAELRKALSAAAPGQDIEKIGLGYLYTGCFSGRWVTHFGSDTQYKGGGDSLVEFFAAANGGQKPQEPGFFWGLWNHPGKFWGEWAFMLIFGLAIPFAAFKHWIATDPTADPANYAKQEAVASAARAPLPGAAPGHFGKRA